MPCVKAYEFQDKIIVKYYDDGLKDTLTCPYCHWYGSLDSNPGLRADGFSEVRCPDCNAKLAMVSISGLGSAH